MKQVVDLVWRLAALLAVLLVVAAGSGVIAAWAWAAFTYGWRLGS